MIKFSKSQGLYGVFSNFYVCNIEYNGLVYRNSEAAFQAQKDISRASEFTNLSPLSAKRLGRSVKLRPDWEEIKYFVMIDVLRAKFSQNEELKNILLNTGNEEIIEDTTSWHDNTWGSCECARCYKKAGLNLLGNALMEVRSELMEAQI